jgi:hypothetical protein
MTETSSMRSAITFSLPVLRRLAIGSGRMLSRRRSERSFSVASNSSASVVACENRRPIKINMTKEPSPFAADSHSETAGSMWITSPSVLTTSSMMANRTIGRMAKTTAHVR